MNKKYLILVYLTVSSNTFGFSSLQDMVNYSAQYDEVAEPDNQDLINPDYFSEYNRRQPSWWRLIGSKLFPKLLPATTILNTLEPLLKALVKDREIQGFNFRHIVRLLNKPNSTLIVWGDLQGSFHSCLRALLELKKQGIISEELKVIKPNCYLIFNGNFMGETNENTELLTCIASLMHKNPDHVFCLVGPLEYHSTWTDQGLIRETSALARARGVKLAWPSNLKKYQTFYQLFTRFFNSLPVALYIDYPTPTDKGLRHQLVRISAFGVETTELDTRFFNDFFDQTRLDDIFNSQDTFTTYRLDNVVESAKPATVRVFITSTDRRVKLEETEGLVELESHNGAIVWSIFSAPTIFQRKINSFNWDAFVKIMLTETLEGATVELLHRDARTEEPFHVESKYFLLTGEDLIKNQSASARTSNLVTIGADLDLSKGASTIGTNLRKGALIALESLQNDLSQQHTELHISFFDNEFSARKSAQNVRSIESKYSLPIIAFPTTLHVMQNYLAALRDGSLLALFPFDSTTELHSKKYPGVIFYRPSFEEEIHALINDALVNTSNGSFCFFYQDDAFGRNAMSVAKAYMHKLNKKEWVEITHLPNEMSFQEAIKKFKKHNFTTLFFFSFPLAVREFIQQLGTKHFLKLDLYGISTLGGRELRHFLYDLGLSMTLTEVVPNPKTSTLPIAQEYRASMDAHGLAYSTFSFEGYIGTALILDALAHIQGRFTKEKLVEYLTSLNNYNFKGLILTFRPEYRDLSQTIWIDRGTLKWEVYQNQK